MTDDDQTTTRRLGPHEQSVLEGRSALRAAESHAIRARRLRKGGAVAAALLLAAGVVSGTVWWSGRDSEVAPAAAPQTLPVKDCPERTPISLWTSAAMESAAADLTRDFEAAADSPCVDFVVSVRNPIESLLGLGKGQPNRADAWIPDSPRWVDRANSAAGLDVTQTLPFGRSPLVIAMAPERAAALGQAPQWSELVSGSVPTRFSDPRSTTAGMLALTAALPTLTGVAGQEAIKRLASTSAPSTEDLFATFNTKPTDAGAFPVSEADLLDHNQANPAHPMVPVVPTEGTPPFEYSLVKLSTEPAKADAIESLRRYLFTPEAATTLAAHHLRSTAVPETLPTVTGAIGEARIGVTPSAAQVAAAADTWQAATVGFRILAVFDVSGSMKEKVGASTRIGVTQEAAGIALGALPTDTELGVWAFSIGIGPRGVDHRELAPIGSLKDAKHRKTVGAAAATLSKYVGGGTGLYDTIWAAYQRVQKDHDPTRVNAVVILTDGKNEDSKGLSLAQLKAKLTAAADPKRPVAVMTIGIGTDVDAKALTEISHMTHSDFYSAPKPQDMTAVLSRALFDHECANGVCV